MSSAQPVQRVFQPEAERAFVRSVLERQAGATERLIERLACIPRFVAVLNARSGRQLDHQSVDDLIQDATVLVLDKLVSYRADAPFESWVQGICRNHFLAELRRKQRARPDSTDVERIPEDRRASHDSLADYERVQLALDGVGGVEAEVIRLRDLEGLTFNEVAERTGIALSTIKTRYYRGFSRLRDILQVREGRFVGKAAS